MRPTGKGYLFTGVVSAARLTHKALRRALCKFLKNFQTGVKCPLFKLAEIPTAHLSLIGEIILRKPLFVTQAAEIGGSYIRDFLAALRRAPHTERKLRILRGRWIVEFTSA